MKKYISIIAAIFMVGATGCKKDFLSLEVNPNAPSVSTPQYLLTGAEKVAADIVNADYLHYGVWAGFYTSSGNFVPSPALQQYQFTDASFNGAWGDLYANLTNFTTLQNQSAADPSQGNYTAIALIMKAYDFEQLVDNFNDVPYTQAFQASTISYPKYDKGAAIYADLFVQLDNAIGLINSSASTANPGTSDIIFGGTMTKWVKFANTLKLRLAIRQSNLAAGSTFAAEIAKTSAGGFLDDTQGATANPGYVVAVGKESPFYGTYGFDASSNPTSNNSYYRANAFNISFLSNNNDPRLAQTWTLVTNPPPGSGQVYRGNVFGDATQFLSNSYTSAIGTGLLKSAAQDAFLLSPAEACFLLSEGALNGYITGGAVAAQDYYQRGITASFVQLGLTAGAATTYYTQTLVNVGWASSPNKQQAIITQKWVALNGYNNLEAYNEYRRTGFPVLPQSADPSAISATLPTRVYYPHTEVTTNGVSLAAEGTISPFTSKIFWAK